MLLKQCLTGMSGLELQRHLARRGTDLPIIFKSGSTDVRAAVRAMKAGAIDFLARPFSNDELLASVRRAFSQADANKKSSQWIADLKRCYDKLTGRELEVLQHVVEGLSSKQVAELLATSRRTVDVQRRVITTKMEATSLLDLARKYALCNDSGRYRLRGERVIIKH